MKPSKHNIEKRLLEIRDGITNLNVEEDFRHILLEDIELAMECFKEKNVLCVLNCLGVLVGKLQTHVILSCCHYSVVKELLISIHCLQQILIRLPICIIGPPGATGPTGPAGSMGPMGPTGGMGPPGPAGITSIITSSCPDSCLPIPKAIPPKPCNIDYSSHMIMFTNSCRK